MPAGTKARARRATGLLAVVFLCCFAAFRLWQGLLSPQGVWQDSYGYEASAGHPFLSTGFWAGSRAPLAPMLWKVTGTPTSFAFVQTCLAVLAWGFLALTIGRLAPSGWRRLLAMAFVLAFACTLPVTEWDWSVLSESLALSSLAAIFAFSIRFVRTTRWGDAAGMIGSAAAFSLARDEDIWTIALIGIGFLAAALVMLAMKRHDARQRTDRAEPGQTTDRRVAPGRTATRRIAVVGGAFVVLAVALEVPAVLSHRYATNITDNLIVRIFPYPDRVDWFAEHGMPDASLVDLAASETVAAPGTAAVVGIDLQTTEFAALNSWINSDGPGTYALWLVEHPGFVLEAPFVRPPLTFNDASGDIGFYASPDRASTVILDRVLFPGLWGELATLAIALGFAWRRSVRRREFWILLLLGALGPVSMLLAWQGDGQEVTRHMVEGSTQTRLAVLLFLLVAALAGSRAHESSDEVLGTEPGPTDRSASSAAPGALPRVPVSPRAHRSRHPKRPAFDTR